jgi:hypothetical protein
MRTDCGSSFLPSSFIFSSHAKLNPGQANPMLPNQAPLGYTQQSLLPTGKRMYEQEGNIPYGFLLEHAKRQRMEYYKALFYVWRGFDWEFIYNFS